MPSTAAQDEFNSLFHGTGRSSSSQPHPEDQHHTSDNESESNNLEQASNGSPSNGRTIRNASPGQGDSSDSDNADARNSNMRSRYFVPSYRSKANTGPKGVIADAQAFQQAKRMHMSSLKLGNGSSAAINGSSLDEPAEPAASTWLLDEDPETDEEDEFLSQWRQSRLKELARAKGRVAGQASSRNPRATGPARYGSLTTVDAVGYLDAVEKTPSDAVVVVFIYDDLSEVSAMTEQCVWELAKSFPAARFVKLHYAEAHMEPAGVPAILAYRGGEKFAGLVPVLDEIPEDDELTPETLAEALRRHLIPL